MVAEVPISRPSPPRPGDYVVVPGTQCPRRDFRCARAGTPRGAWFYVSEAVRTPRVGMKGRVESGQPALSGMFTRAEVTYAWPRDDGTVGSDRDPGPFTGKAVHAYLGHLSDAAIEAILNELATELGAAFGQFALMSPGRAYIWMPASIAGDTWPGVLATTSLVTERRVFVCRADGNLGSIRTYCSAGAVS